MSRSRRKSRPAMTLFAFQDIIMSVSGIIIVIVLLLTLELIQPSPPRSAGAADVALDLQNAIAAAELDHGGLQAEIEQSDRLVREAAIISPEELRRRIAAEDSQIDRLGDELAVLRSRIEQLEQAKRDTEVQRFDRQPQREALEANRVQAAALREQIEAEQNDNRPLFAMPRGTRQRGWAIVVSEDYITAAPMGQPSRPQKFHNRGGVNGKSPTSQFIDWCRSHKSGSVYLLLLIRPSGVELFDDLQPRLDAERLSYGFDVVSEHQVVLDPERGAGE